MRENVAYFAYNWYFCVMLGHNNSVLVQGATLADIEKIVKAAIDERMASFYETIRQKPPVLVKRKDAARRLGISLPTLDAYGRCGILHPRHIGGRVFYEEAELLSVKGG